MKHTTSRFSALGALAVGAAAMGAYACLVEPRRILVNRYELGKDAPPMRLVQLSDIHISASFPVERLERVVRRVNALRPDMVVFTGDLFTRYASYGDAAAASRALGRLCARYGKFAVWGNHDKVGGCVSVYANLLESAGFTLLVNETTRLFLANGAQLLVGGLDDAIFGKADLDGLCREMAVAQADYKLLLMHEPDLADGLLPGAANLVLAGHSHGGQVRLPLLGAPVSAQLARKYVAGFYWVNGTRLFVNSGVGTSALPVRFLAPPEIAVFTQGKECKV